jgi:hypothetical protein
LCGFAVDYAARTVPDMVSLGITLTLLLTLIPVKAAVDYYGGRRHPPVEADDASKRHKLSGSLERELSLAPLELTARRERYENAVAQIKKITLKEELLKGSVLSLKFLGTALAAVFACYAVYRGHVTIGAATALVVFILTFK